MTDHTFRHYAIDLLSEGASESLVDLYHRDGTPLPRTTEDEAQERRAFLDHMAYLLDCEDYAEFGNLLGPMIKRHIEESILGGGITSKADRDLIASAPELLEALMNTLPIAEKVAGAEGINREEQTTQTLQAAHAAIAKARGEQT